MPEGQPDLGRNVAQRLHFTLHQGVAQRIWALTAKALSGQGPARVLVAGPRGSGKTAILRSLSDMAKTTENAAGRVVWVPALAIQGIHTATELLFACWDALEASPRGAEVQAREQPLPEDLSAMGAGGPVIFLLDGPPNALILDASRASFAAFLAERPNISVIAGMAAPNEEAVLGQLESMAANTPFALEFLHPVAASEVDRYLLRGAASKRNSADKADSQAVCAAKAATLRDLAAGCPGHLAALAPLMPSGSFRVLSKGLHARLGETIAPRLREQLAELSPQQRRTLTTLARVQGRPLSVKTLSAQMRATSQTCSKQLHELHRAGWVHRHAVGRESRYEFADVLARMAFEEQLEGADRTRPGLETLMLWRMPLETTPPESEAYETPWGPAFECAASAITAPKRHYDNRAADSSPGLSVRPHDELERCLATARSRLQKAPRNTAAAFAELHCLLALERFAMAASRAHELAALPKRTEVLRTMFGLFEGLALAEGGQPGEALERVHANAEHDAHDKKTPAEVRAVHGLVMGRTERALGHTEAALKAFTAAFQHARDANAAARSVLIAHALLEKGVLLAVSGADESSSRTLEYAEDAARKCADPTQGALLEAAAALDAGMVLARMKQLDAADRAFVRAAQAASPLESAVGQRIKAKGLLGHAGTLRALRKSADALDAYDRAAAAAEAGPFLRLCSEAHLAKASMLWGHGRLEEVSALHSRVLDAIPRETPGPAFSELAQALAGRTLAAVVQHDANAACDLLDETITLHRAHPDSGDLFRAIVLSIEGFLCTFGSAEQPLGQLRSLLEHGSEPYLARALLLLLKRRLPLDRTAAERLGPFQEAAQRVFEDMPDVANGLAMLHAACETARGKARALLELPLELRRLLEPATGK